MKWKIWILLVALLVLTGCSGYWVVELQEPAEASEVVENAAEDEPPEYAGEPFAVLNGNVPGFTEEDYTTEAFE